LDDSFHLILCITPDSSYHIEVKLWQFIRGEDPALLQLFGLDVFTLLLGSLCHRLL